MKRSNSFIYYGTDEPINNNVPDMFTSNMKTTMPTQNEPRSSN